MNQVWLAFITGLTSGGISCLAVQGGLLATAAGQSVTSGEKKSSSLIVASFLTAKIASHFLLGLMLGGLGSMFVLSPKSLGLVQIFAGIFMLVTAARLANIHPVFRYFVIQPPGFIFKFLRNTAKGETIFAPAILGFFSVFMPCGITQAMMVVAVGTGNPILGGLVMGAFVLGTSPLFLLLGSAVVELLKLKTFSYIAAAIVAIFGIMSLNGGLAARGSVYTLQNYWKALTVSTDKPENENNKPKANIEDGFQKVTVTVTNSGYTSDVSVIKVGIPVRMTVITNNVHSCARAFTIPEFNISKILPPTGQTVIEFTPNKTGRLPYSCSMGMYTGELTVE